MIQINLLPSVKQELIRAKHTRNTVISISIIAGLGAIGLVVVLLLVLSVQNLRDTQATKRIEEEFSLLKKENKDINELVTLQAQLANIGTQHESKLIASRMFSVVEASVPDEEALAVQFTNVSLIPMEQTMVIEGNTVNGYRSVEAAAKTLLNAKIEYEGAEGVLEESLVSGVEVSDTSLRGDSDGDRVVSFSIRVTVNQILFSSKIDGLKVVTPRGKVDVTDSRIGVPETMFTSNVEEDDNE